MSLYYAEHIFQQNFGIFTDDVQVLQTYAEPLGARSGTCSKLPMIELIDDGSGFLARVEDLDSGMVAMIRNDRLLTVE